MKTALIIEDNPQIREDYREGLELRGYEVSEVKSNLGVNELWRQGNTYNLALVDHRLWGGIAGAEIALELAERKIAEYVVLVTAYPEALKTAKLEKLGIPVKKKPCTLSEILNEIENV